MVLGGQPPGRVGRRRDFSYEGASHAGAPSSRLPPPARRFCTLDHPAARRITLTDRRPRGQSQSKGRAKPSSGKGAPKPARAGGVQGQAGGPDVAVLGELGEREAPEAVGGRRLQWPEALVRRSQTDERRGVIRPPPGLRCRRERPEAGVPDPQARVADSEAVVADRKPASGARRDGPARDCRSSDGPRSASSTRSSPAGPGRAGPVRHGWAHRSPRRLPGRSAAPGRPAEEARPRLDRRAPLRRDVAPGPRRRWPSDRHRRDAAGRERSVAPPPAPGPRAPQARTAARRPRDTARPAPRGRQGPQEGPPGPGARRDGRRRARGPGTEGGARGVPAARVGRAAPSSTSSWAAPPMRSRPTGRRTRSGCLRPLRTALPASATVRELLGVALYRSGRYDQAAEELEAYVALCGAVDQHPALMDCYRALQRLRPGQGALGRARPDRRGARGRRRGAHRLRRAASRTGVGSRRRSRCSTGAPPT